MGATASTVELEFRASGNDLDPVVDVFLQRALQRQDTRLRALLDEREHVDAECLLEGSVLEEVVEHLHRLRVALELDDNAHARAVRFVAQAANAVQLALTDHVGDSLQQRRLVNLVRQLGHDNLVAIAALGLFSECLGAHHDPAATRGVRGLDALAPENGPGGREVRPGDDFEQVFEGRVGIVDQQRDCVADLVEVVRRDIRRHTDRDAGATVDEQLRHASGQDDRLLHRCVVVRTHVDGVLVDVDHHLVGDGR